MSHSGRCSRGITMRSWDAAMRVEVTYRQTMDMTF